MAELNEVRVGDDLRGLARRLVAAVSSVPGVGWIEPPTEQIIRCLVGATAPCGGRSFPEPLVPGDEARLWWGRDSSVAVEVDIAVLADHPGRQTAAAVRSCIVETVRRSGHRAGHIRVNVLTVSAAARRTTP